MPIDAACRCGKRLRAPDAALGRTARCPACGSIVHLVRPAARDDETARSPAPRREDPPAAVSFGRFQILAELGQGGMGVVYRARDPMLGREVAVKILRGLPARSDSVQATRFRREARAAAALKHPGIVQILEFGEEGGQLYLAAELVDGRTLADALTCPDGGPRPGLETFLGLVEAVAYAHEHGVVHRDLKPSNVLIDRSGRPRLTDFGLARIDGEASLTGSREVLGTLAYMAPEQIEGQASVRSDVYSLGVILYEILTGRPPHVAETHAVLLKSILLDEATPPSAIDPRVEPAIEAICLGCLAKDPGSRPATAAALAKELRAYLAGERSARRPAPAARSPVGTTRRRRVVAGLVAAGLTLVVAGGLALRRHAPNHPAGSGAGAGAASDPRPDAAEPEPLPPVEPLLDSAAFAHDRTLQGRKGGIWAPSGVRALRLVGGGRFLLAATTSGVLVRDLAGSDTACLEGPALDLAVSPSERRVVAAAPNGDFSVWETSSWRSAGAFDSSGSYFGSSVAIDPEERRVYSVRDDVWIVEWDLSRGTKLRELAGHEDPILALAMGPGGRCLYAIDAGGRLGEHDLSSGTLSREWHRKKPCRVAGLTLAPGGEHLLATFDSGSVELDLGSWTVVREFAGGRQAAYSADGRRVYTVGEGRVLELDRESGKVARGFGGHSDAQVSFCLAPDDRTLYSGSVNELRIRRWDLASGLEAEPPELHRDRIATVAVSPSGAVAATADVTGRILVWDLSSGTLRWTLDGTPDMVFALTFLDDVAVFSGAGLRVQEWDVSTGKLVQTFTAPEVGRVYSVRPSASGGTVWACGQGSALVEWDRGSGRVVSRITEDVGWLYDFAFVPGTDRLFGLARDGRILEWDSRTGRRVSELARDAHPFKSCLVTGEGTRLLARGAALVEWDLRAGSSRVLTREPSPNGFDLIAPSGPTELIELAADDLLLLWDVDSGRPAGNWRTPPGLSSVAASADGRIVVTTHWSNDICVWRRR